MDNGKFQSGNNSVKPSLSNQGLDTKFTHNFGGGTKASLSTSTPTMDPLSTRPTGVKVSHQMNQSTKVHGQVSHNGQNTTYEVGFKKKF